MLAAALTLKGDDMNRGGGKAIMALLGALAATPAAASDKTDFESCDGRMHPGRQQDGLRGFVGAPRFRLAQSPDAVVAACTRALASPRLLPTQTLRRAHLLRARAAAHLRLGRPDAALQDLKEAEAAASAIAGDRFFQRSMGVSFQLLRAIALVQSGDTAAALPFARAAMEARSYALEVQQVAASVLQLVRSGDGSSPSPWLQMVRLDPDAGATALIKEAEAGNFTGVLDLRKKIEPAWPAERLKPFALAVREGAGAQFLSAVIVSLHVAYARAATGDADGAQRELANVRTHVDAARPAPADGQPAGLVGTPFAAVDKYVEARSRQIQARIAVAQGRPSEAISALIASPMPRDAATVELLKALRAAVPAKDAALVPPVTPFEKESSDSRREALAHVIPAALIAPETPRALVDYEKARPNILGALIGGALSMGTSLLGGIQRTDGFRETAQADGTTKVEFIGNTPSAPVVQEMTLLRAAEVTRAAGKPAFVIAGRKDYARRLATMQYGMEVSSIPTGFKTELTIRPVEAGTPGALDAVAIIDALGPLYYEAAPAKN